MDSFNPFEQLNQRFDKLESLFTAFLPQQTKVELQTEGGIDFAKEVIQVLTKSTIYKKTMDGSIPCQKRGKVLWFTRENLQKWLDSGMPDCNVESSQAKFSRNIATQANRKLKNR
jgi:hypothetical protein